RNLGRTSKSSTRRTKRVWREIFSARLPRNRQSQKCCWGQKLRRRAWGRMKPDKPMFVAYGGGTNSTALLVGLAEREQRPDLILFADTGGEKPETYAHLNTMNEWLVTRGFPLITVVHKSSKYASLEDECLTRKTLPSLAFGWRSCSDKWKQEPQRKFLNHWEPAR